MDWTNYLCGFPAMDYIFQEMPYEEQIMDAVKMIQNAEHILIGAGSGLSAAAGLTYSGKRFEDNFPEFIEKYGMTDMYSAGFYSFSSEEERWGYWSKHSFLNRIAPPVLPLYKALFELVKEKDYFVLTTNVDAQFQKAGFDQGRIFATQGDYGLIQCARGCHSKNYDATELFMQMNESRKDCRIPTKMVPKCPVCGGSMAMHLRSDQYFVEDEAWQEAASRYGVFLEKIMKRNTILLELGVGFNTPTIIRFPFEKMMRENDRLQMIRINLEDATIPESFGKRAVGIGKDINSVINDIMSQCCHSPQVTSPLQKRMEQTSQTNQMSQEDRLDYLVDALRKDSDDYKDMQVPRVERRKVMRSLMNIRGPKPIPPNILVVQDEFLQEEARQKGNITLQDILTIKQAYHSNHAYADQISIWQGDITRLAVDGIVNAANAQMLGCFVPCHRCIDNAIHSAAGMELREACFEYMEKQRKVYGQNYEEPTGKAIVTPGFNLPCNYVIHTVGPIVEWKLTDRLRDDLKNCYRSCLEAAVNKGMRSIAFCCISTGEFHFPNEEAAKIAVETVTDFLAEQEGKFDRIIFNVFKDFDKAIYKEELTSEQRV